MSDKIFKGTVFYASKNAMKDKYYKEGERVTIVNYHAARMLDVNFYEIDFDSTGTCYIHLDTSKS